MISKQKRTIQNMLLSICTAIFILLVCATAVYAGYSDKWKLPDGAKSWAEMDTVDITWVSGTYHSIDLKNYGTNCSTVVSDADDGYKTFDELHHGNATRVLYQRKVKVACNDIINLVAATKDEGSGGSNIVSNGKFYWNVIEHDSSGNAIYDSGWMETSTAYKIGVTTTSNGLLNQYGYSRNNVAYIILVFRYATGDMSTGAPSPEVTPEKMAEELPNLHLCYNPFTYTVDNQGSKSTIDRTGIETLSNPLTSPTKTGHTFTGWKVTSSNTTGGTNWMNGNTYTTDQLNTYLSDGKFYTSLFGNVTFTAQFTVNTYTVTYYGNGATGGETSANTATYGQSFITTKNGYVKQGYQFNGWAKTAAGPPTDGWGLTSVGVFESGQYWTWSYTSDLNLYAQWSPNTYAINYYGNGETGGSTDSSYHTYGEWAKLSKNGFYKTGYTFRGWSPDTGEWSYNLDGAYRNFNTFNPAFYANAYSDLYNALGYNADALYAHYRDHGIHEGRACVADISDDRTLYPDQANVVNLTHDNLTHNTDYALSLFAQWTPNTYTVTLNGNGATSTNHTTSVTATYDAAMPSITKPSRVYTVTYDANGGSCSTASNSATYTFNGYYTATSGGTQYYKSDGSSAKNWDKTSDTTLYAQWTSASVTLPTPTRTGYTFQGWYEDSSFTTKAGDAGATYTPTKAIKLYAKWKVNTYNQIVQVRYENADGSFTAYEDVINKNYNYGSTVSWSRNADTTYKAASITSYTVTKANTTQVTVYRKTFSVNLTKGTGISAVTGSGTYRVGQSVTVGATLLSNTAQYTYGWSGWTETYTSSNQSYTFTMPSQDVSLTANGTQTVNKYKQVVQVRYQNADGTWGAYSNVINKDYEYGSTVSWSVAQTWSHKAASITSYTVTGEKTTKVDIARRTYTLKFVKGDNNVSSVPAEQTCLAGNDLSATCTSKTGYHLTKYTGTKYDGSGTDTWTECSGLNSHTSSWTMHANRTITVYSTANTYTIKFDSNNKSTTPNNIYGDTFTTDPTGSTASVTATYDSNVTLTKNGFTRVGYTFKGWSKTPSAKTAEFSDGQTLTKPNFTSTNNGSVTLYAIWEPITYTIKYDKGLTDSTTAVPSSFTLRFDQSGTLSGIGNIKGTSYKLVFDTNKPSNATSTPTSVSTITGNLSFKDWSLSNTESNAYRNGSTIKNLRNTSGTVTVTAQWNSETLDGFTSPTLTGWTFQGWSTSASTNDKTTTLTVSPSTSAWSKTLYAQWKANTYYVSYDKGLTNNSGTTSTSTHTYDNDVTLRANGFTGRSYSLYFNGNKPKDDKGVTTAGTVTNLQSTKSGKLSFNNWYITNAHNNNKTYASANTNLGKKNYRTDNGGTATATAQWNSVTLKDYSSPSLTGYKFNGYFTAATGGTKTTTITVDPSTTAYSNTLYAQWTPITYKVRFNGNGNWNTAQGSYTQTITYDTHTALTANKFTRPDNTTYNDTPYKIGYEFVGWGTSPNQTTPTYTDGQEVFNLTATDGQVIDLYAIWKKTVTLTINFNGGKFNNSTDSKVLSYTMYNSELNHTFDIKEYYGKLAGTGYYDKGLNNNLTKTVDGIQYRFLGYSLTQASTIPDVNFDTFAYTTRTEAYNIRDNTTLYAIWEPVLQMTASLSTSDGHAVPIQLTNVITIHNALGNIVIPSGTKNTALPNAVTAYTKNEFNKINTTNSSTVSYTVSAKGGSNIKFGMAIDSRILDIYTNGKDNSWYDELNQLTDFDYKIADFSTVTDDFVIPKYLGTTNSYKSSNPNSSDNSIVYGIKFTCTQPSYYYEKYWNTTESISIYGIIFLQPTETPDGEGEGDLPDYGDFNFQTILQ